MGPVCHAMHNTFATPKTTPCPLYGPQDENVPGSSTVGWDGGAWVQVCGCFCCWWCHLLTVLIRPCSPVFTGPLVLAHSWQRLWFALALLRQCPKWRLVLTLAFFWQPLVSVSGLALWQCYLPTPCLAILCRGLQRFGFCGSCFLSPACKLDASGSLGRAWYGTPTGSAPPRSCSGHAHRLPRI